MDTYEATTTVNAIDALTKDIMALRAKAEAMIARNPRAEVSADIREFLNLLDDNYADTLEHAYNKADAVCIDQDNMEADESSVLRYQQAGVR